MTQAAFVSTQSHKQVGGTCYANAVATVIRAAENRIIGRKPKSHKDLVKDITDKHGVNGGYTYKVLKEECNKRQLRCRSLWESGAIAAVQSGRPIIATFRLDNSQWDTFSKFFCENKTGILTQLNMKPKGWLTSLRGHAVCIMGVNVNQNYWQIKNSWGDNWADGGYCRMSFDVVSFRYYDCYFLVQDLTQNDIQHPIIKRYDSLIPLGKGAFGEVFKAFDLQNINKDNNPSTVAIKKVSKTDYKVLKRELSLLSSCDSKYVIKMLDCHIYNNYAWIVLEYCTGGSIANRRNKCNELELNKIAYDVLNGLSYLHSKNIIHRDIKPENILHSSNGIYKLADFGISKDITKTLKKTFNIGTPYFMAPEIIKEINYNEKVDIWSFGITLFNLITGKFPFSASSNVALSIKIVNNQPIKLNPNSNANGFSSGICDIVNNKCLIKNHTRRYSANQLLNHSWFKDDDDDIDMDDKSNNNNASLIAYCESIKSMVAIQYPSAYAVWCIEPKGTILALKAKGIIEAQELFKEFDMPYKKGYNNISAWKEYKTSIYDYLTIINDDDRLKKARQILANEIWINHSKKFPYWPQWPFNKINTDIITLNKKDKYIHNKWFIVWSVGGSITITDHRPSAFVYKAKFNGKPTLRILKVDNKQFNDFNTLCKKNQIKAIQHVKQYSNQALTWDSL